MLITYHHIIPKEKIPKQLNNKEGWLWSLTPKQFKNNLLLLQKKGYSFISIDEKIAEINKFGKEIYKNIVLTFDDGWLDNFIYAYPILKELNIPAVFYITTQHLFSGQPDKTKISIQQIKILNSNNITIGCHTRNHKTLTGLTKEELNEEIIGSKNDIENILDSNVNHFAYPGGAFNKTVIDMVKKAGFISASSIISPALNNKRDLFWLYRNHFSNNMGSLPDKYRLCTPIIKLLRFRITNKLRKKLI